MKRRSVLLVSSLIALAFAAGACSNGSSDSPAVQAGQVATTAPVATSPPTTVGVTSSVTTAPAPSTTAAASVRKVNANTASQSEIQAALQDAGVPSPGQWAREVVEYRPYPTNDPNLAKLRQNLVKYNPGPGVVDGIVSALAV